MNKKHTMPSRLIELEHELSAALLKLDEQRELLRLSQEENEEKRKDIVYLATQKAKLEERIKRLEDAGDELICHLSHNIKTDHSDPIWHSASIKWGKVKKEAKL